MEENYVVRSATADDLEAVVKFLRPFMDQELVLRRTSIELELLLRHAFMAFSGSQIVGFVALEVYNKKLAEIQCLGVCPNHRRMGIGRELVRRCVERGREQKVREVMAITATDEMFQNCGFDYALPGQKRALFVQTEGNETEA